MQDRPVNQPNESQPFSNGHQVTGRDHGSGVVGHAQQGFVQDQFAGHGVVNRLVGQLEQPVLQAFDNLGGTTGIQQALGLAFFRRCVNHITIRWQAEGFTQGFFGMGDGFGSRVAQGGQTDSANAEKGPDRTVPGFNHTVAHRPHETFKGKIQFLWLATVEDDAKLAAGVAGNTVTQAHDMAQALTQGHYHFVGDFETIGFIHDIEIVDGKNGKGTG